MEFLRFAVYVLISRHIPVVLAFDIAGTPRCEILRGEFQYDFELWHPTSEDGQIFEYIQKRNTDSVDAAAHTRGGMILTIAISSCLLQPNRMWDEISRGSQNSPQ